MKIHIHLSQWYLKPFKNEGYMNNVSVSTANIVWAKTYSILCFTLYKYNG